MKKMFEWCQQHPWQAVTIYIASLLALIAIVYLLTQNIAINLALMFSFKWVKKKSSFSTNRDRPFDGV
ncbi:hypothetical protein JK163_04250 [Levilactobacillus brevis]|uniref:hypothetical protein n=1 Tax=Levilactobacillus brevis TaxID=1580 RepID=UPI001BA63F06|nr:hypothetical protein [Levilactobacillus brevis]MBS1005518.1 hypothetical protein [Levilactobacillus brevis]